MVTKIVYQIVDASGDVGTTEIRVGGAPTNVGLNGFGAGWATAMNNMIAGKILSAAAYLLANISGLTGNLIGAQSDVEHIGKFQFLTAGGTRVSVNVPCLSEIALGATTVDDLNQAQPDVAAFIAAMTDGVAVTGGVIMPCDIGELGISGVVFAREAYRNSGKRR